MNEERSLHPHYAVMVHFLDDAARYLFDAEEDSDFATLGEFTELEDAVQLADKFHRRYTELERSFTVQLMLNPVLFTTVYIAGLTDKNVKELEERASQSWKSLTKLIPKH